MSRIWRAHQLKPHRVRTFQLSNDPRFAEKLEDGVELFLHPPLNSDVWSADEMRQIQALTRTQPSLPCAPGHCATQTHDDKRHGATTLFAALNVGSGEVVHSFHSTVIQSGSPCWARLKNTPRPINRFISSSITTRRTNMPT